MRYTVIKSLNESLRRLLKSNPSIFILGEDIADPYGGAFKVTKGLSGDYSERVLVTPISEAAITGMAAGMAMKGARPIVEIMFGDFLALCADQIINHIAKYRWMYNEKVQMPVLLRTPMGGRMGYGPTHSQSLEKIFMGIPGLRIIAINLFTDPGRLLEEAVGVSEPVVFIENKWLYPKAPYTVVEGYIGSFAVRFYEGGFPTCILSSGDFEAADITVVAYGGMAEVVFKAAEKILIENEIICEIIAPTHIKPLNIKPILDSLDRTRNLVIFEEGTENFGWGREVIYKISEEFHNFETVPRAIGARNFPVANVKKLEMEILPQEDDVTDVIKAMLDKGAR